MKKMLLVIVALCAVLASTAAADARKARPHGVARPAVHATQARHAVVQSAARLPCAAYNWTGCLGRDPDPRVRLMIRHDSTLYDD